MSQQITVLVVDNEPGYADLVGSMLERETSQIEPLAARSGETALELFENREIHCIVSDYEMSTMTGLELLERIRAVDPDLPFILYTGRGSEELASEAIAAGVTQYFQKEPGEERYAVLANRITNAVSQYRTETELRESERRYERTLTTLHETTRDLMRAETKEDIYQSAVDTAGEILDVQVAAAYRFRPTEGILEHVASMQESRELVDAERSFERGTGLVWEVFSEGESTYYQDVQRTDVEHTRTLSRSELIVPLGTHGVLVAGTEDVDGFDETMTELLHILAANTEAALDRAEREQLLREHDRTLTEQNEELTRLNHTNEIVRQINHGVTQATTRTEIETTVCESLADTDRYLFAWIATTDDEPPTPAAWAGIDAAHIDQIRDDGEDAPEIELVRETLTTEQVQTVRDVLEADRWDRRRRDALTYGYQTVLSVPLVDDERQYGVLLVHVPGVDAITESEREVFGELGETIGHAIRSIEQTRAMLTDSRLELELTCRDDRLLLNRLSTHADGPVTFEGVIDRDDEVVVFVCAPSTARLDSVTETWASIESVSIVSSGDDETLFEMTLSPTPFLDVLRTYEAQLRKATGVDGETELVLELPHHTEVRALIEALRESYPETELDARRETPEIRSARQLDTYLAERLTEKQFEALQAAHYSGFFEWPRESTGEDLAEALGVSPPTYHYHLRAAEGKLVTLAFDGMSN